MRAKNYGGDYCRCDSCYQYSARGNIFGIAHNRMKIG